MLVTVVIDGPVNLPVSVPDVKGLTDQEKSLIATLDSGFLRDRFQMQVSDAYYTGGQRIKNLRIAVPVELEFLRTIVGWPALAVDPYVERLQVDGFRLPGATSADQLLTDLWITNDLASLLPLALTDALAIGHGYWMLGTSPDGDEIPKVTVESPLNVAVKWDLSGTKPEAAWQTYWQDGRYHGVLMTPNVTVSVATDDSGNWQVVSRDEHNLGFVPLIRMPYAPRTNQRGGRSAITPAIRSITDSACRDLLALEVSREFYSVPRITMLGATEADFVNSDGTAKTAWETLITRFNAFERDEEGNLPEIHQTSAYDPSVFTKLLDMRASQISSHVAAPPQDLGLFTSGNPTSADAVGAMEARRARRGGVMQRTFGVAIADLMKMQMQFMGKGKLPDKYRNVIAEWTSLEDVSFAARSDAMTKQIGAGVVLPDSDIALRKLGYTAYERAVIKREREEAADRAAAEQVANENQPVNDDNAGA